jgi:glycosyltransferase involved in cell wall biosynthesis
LKIWIVNHYAIPATESGGTRHYSLAQELVRRGHEVSIVAADFHHGAQSHMERTNDSREHGASAGSVQFVWVRTPPYAGNGMARVRNMLTFACRVWEGGALKQLDAPDLIFGSSPHPFAALAAQRLARRYGVPFVLEVRDLWPDSLIEVAGVSPRHPFVLLLYLLEHYLYRAADTIVTVLPAAADYIAQRGGRLDKIVWIPNGVDFQIAPPVAPHPRAELFTVMYAGTLGRANAVDSMLRAAQLLASHVEPKIQFRFVGDGPERGRLRRSAEELGLDNVHFDDAVPKHRIYDTLQGADVLLATTRNIDLYKYGISFNKLFDYLAAGRPIVFGANCPGNPVTDAAAGEVVPPEDSTAMAAAIARIAAMSPEQREEIGARGRQFAEANYDMKRLTDRLEDAFVLARSSASVSTK